MSTVVLIGIGFVAGVVASVVLAAILVIRHEQLDAERQRMRDAGARWKVGGQG